MADHPTYPLTEDGVREALRALGDGSEDVAGRLEQLGIKGFRDDDCSCPVANYLRKTFPDIETVWVLRDNVFIEAYQTDEFGFGLPVKFDTSNPDPVSAFVGDFDAGIYPELIEEASNV